MIYTFEFDYVPSVENMPVENLTVVVHLRRVIDNNYGADADGNRGIRTGFLEFKKIELFDGPRKIPESEDMYKYYLAAKEFYDYHLPKAEQEAFCD